MRTPLTTLKMAVFAPMPSASVISTMAVNMGACANRRHARDLMESNTARREFGSQGSSRWHGSCWANSPTAFSS